VFPPPPFLAALVYFSKSTSIVKIKKIIYGILTINIGSFFVLSTSTKCDILQKQNIASFCKNEER